MAAKKKVEKKATKEQTPIQKAMANAHAAAGKGENPSKK